MARHQQGWHACAGVDGRKADEIESKDEKRLHLGRRQSQLFSSEGKSCRTAGRVLARKPERAGVIGRAAAAFAAVSIAGFLVRLFGSLATMAATARAGIGADGAFTWAR